MNEKLLSSLSMARGAGKLKIGHDAAADAVRAGAVMVVFAGDASERTKQSIQKLCSGQCEILILEETQDDILVKFGKRFAVAAVTDRNFAALIKKNLNAKQEEPNDHSEI